jgi:very-short-patch-repair endonuclease
MKGKSAIHVAVALAARQKSLVTLDQLRDRGVAPRQVEHWIRAGWLHHKHAGVYAVGHPTLTPQGRWLAATLALRGVLSHTSAAALWGILPFTKDLHVTVPTCHGRAHRDGIRVHRRPLPRHQVTALHGIPVTALGRTLLDLAATQPLPALERAFEQAQVEHRLRPARLATEALTRPGQRGTAKLRAILSEAVEPGKVESILELRFLQFCEKHGLRRPLTQVWFGPWRADFLFKEEGVAVETDSRKYHATAARRRKDAEKTAYVEALGLRMIRLRWVDVVHHPARALAALANGGVSPR